MTWLIPLLLWQSVEVRIYGSLREVMHAQDYSSKITLNLLGPMEYLVGVGAGEGLNGEITISGGEALIGTYSDNMYALDKSTNTGAALLVVSEVTKWKVVEISQAVSSLDELSRVIGVQLTENGLTGATPVRIEATGKTEWHIIRAPKPGEDHKSAAKTYRNSGQFELVGFYSTSHEGVFTHRGQSLHLHYIGPDRTFTGHLDALSGVDHFKLFLPE